jgi:hypothetical protein
MPQTLLALSSRTHAWWLPIKSYATPTVLPRIMYNVTVKHTHVLAGLNWLFNSLTCIDGEQ